MDFAISSEVSYTDVDLKSPESFFCFPSRRYDTVVNGFRSKPVHKGMNLEMIDNETCYYGTLILNSTMYMAVLGTIL